MNSAKRKNGDLSDRISMNCFMHNEHDKCHNEFAGKVLASSGRKRKCRCECHVNGRGN